MSRPPPKGVISANFGFAGDFVHIRSHAHRAHAHGEIELNLVCGDPLRYLFAGSTVEFPAKRWLAYWAALPHRVLAVPGDTHLAWITVPLDTYLGWCPQDQQRRLLGGEIICQPQPEEGAVARAREWTASLRGSDPQRRRIVALEVEALVRRLGLGAASIPIAGSAQRVGDPPPRRTRRAPARSPASLAMVEAMCSYLAAQYTQDVTVAQCARAAGLHQQYAMALFQRTCGTTIGRYLCRLRLAHAQRLLLTTTTAVLPIALAAGFGSQARFYVAFKRAFATTPAAYRRAHRALERPPHPPGEW